MIAGQAQEAGFALAEKRARVEREPRIVQSNDFLSPNDSTKAVSPAPEIDY